MLGPQRTGGQVWCQNGTEGWTPNKDKALRSPWLALTPADTNYDLRSVSSRGKATMIMGLKMALFNARLVPKFSLGSLVRHKPFGRCPQPVCMVVSYLTKNGEINNPGSASLIGFNWWHWWMPTSSGVNTLYAWQRDLELWRYFHDDHQKYGSQKALSSSFGCGPSTIVFLVQVASTQS